MYIYHDLQHLNISLYLDISPQKLNRVAAIETTSVFKIRQVF